MAGLGEGSSVLSVHTWELCQAPEELCRRSQSTSSGEVINITQNITCMDVGCLYLLSCTKQNCRKQYIGESGRQIYKRFKEHQDSSEDPYTTCPVGLHFQLPGHSKTDIELVPIMIVSGDKAVRKERETI